MKTSDPLYIRANRPAGDAINALSLPAEGITIEAAKSGEGADRDQAFEAS